VAADIRLSSDEHVRIEIETQTQNAGFGFHHKSQRRYRKANECEALVTASRTRTRKTLFKIRCEIDENSTFQSFKIYQGSKLLRENDEYSPVPSFVNVMSVSLAYICFASTILFSSLLRFKNKSCLPTTAAPSVCAMEGVPVVPSLCARHPSSPSPLGPHLIS
jgi:hypothetical protein